MGTIEGKISELAQKVAGPMGFTVEAVEISGSGRRPVLRIYIDKEGGVNIADCEAVSREMSALLDVEDVMQGAYILEVSSPGLDRPLRKPADFARQTGKLARVVTKEPFEGQTFMIGRIVEAGGDFFTLNVGEREVKIPYEAVTRARLEVEIK